MSDRRLRLIHGPPEFAKAVLQALDETTIRIALEDTDPPWRRQLLVIALADLLGRLFPRIDISLNGDPAAHPLLPPGQSTLRGRLEGARSHGMPPRASGQPAAVIAVGEVPIEGATLYCDGDGWNAYLGREPSQLAAADDEGVAVGPLAAACRAAARAFAVALAEFRGPPGDLESLYWSALQYQATAAPLAQPGLPAPTHIEAVLAGAGSIGGAAAYCLAHTPNLSGTLDVIDPQSLEAHNPDRALLATEQSAAAGVAKVDAVKTALAHHTNLHTRPHPDRFADWVAGQARGPIPLVLCAFDSVPSRRELQDSLPLEVVNAACGEDDIAVSGHLTGEGPCVYCLHMPDVLATGRIRFRLIVEASGLPDKMVQTYLEKAVPLGGDVVEMIEDHRGLPAGSLAAYRGRTLDDLYREQLLYGETVFDRDGGRAAVAAPFVTALAGTLLAGEALKAGSSDVYQTYRLGPWQPGRTRYEEKIYRPLRDAIVGPVARWPGTECLCQSTRRQRLLRDRYV